MLQDALVLEEGCRPETVCRNRSPLHSAITAHPLRTRLGIQEKDDGGAPVQGRTGHCQVHKGSAATRQVTKTVKNQSNDGVAQQQKAKHPSRFAAALDQRSSSTRLRNVCMNRRPRRDVIRQKQSNCYTNIGQRHSHSVLCDESELARALERGPPLHGHRVALEMAWQFADWLFSIRLQQRCPDKVMRGQVEDEGTAFGHPSCAPDCLDQILVQGIERPS